ncbi:MAG: 2-amino-4-hydroxy-6-hydroxymethyldihydropteridine diphosphokinase [Peptococcaceae bacterium]
MINAYLGLGSNLGNKERNLRTAVSLLEQHPQIIILKKSSLYESEPVGFTEQDWFLNGVVKIGTSLGPYELLKYCQFIEETLKRKRPVRWGPRTIDVDILFYEGVGLADEKLTIPHPRMTERAFVMVPLAEIEPGLVLNGKNIKDILASLRGERINKLTAKF